MSGLGFYSLEDIARYNLTNQFPREEVVRDILKSGEFVGANYYFTPAGPTLGHAVWSFPTWDASSKVGGGFPTTTTSGTGASRVEITEKIGSGMFLVSSRVVFAFSADATRRGIRIYHQPAGIGENGDIIWENAYANFSSATIDFVMTLTGTVECNVGDRVGVAFLQETGAGLVFRGTTNGCRFRIIKMASYPV